jgi:hypothetical protein
LAAHTALAQAIVGFEHQILWGFDGQTPASRGCFSGLDCAVSKPTTARAIVGTYLMAYLVQCFSVGHGGFLLVNLKVLVVTRKARLILFNWMIREVIL